MRESECVNDADVKCKAKVRSGIARHMITFCLTERQIDTFGTPELEMMQVKSSEVTQYHGGERRQRGSGDAKY